MTTEELKQLKPWTWLVFDSGSERKYDSKYGIYYALLFYGTINKDNSDFLYFPMVFDMTDQGQTLIKSLKGEGDMRLYAYSPGTYEIWEENDYLGYFKSGLRKATRIEEEQIKDFLENNRIEVVPNNNQIKVPDEIEDDVYFDCSELLEGLNSYK